MTRPLPPDDVWALAAEKLPHGEPFCLATVVRATSQELPMGTKGLFTGAGAAAGPPALRRDAALAQHAAAALSRRHSALVEGADGSQVFLDVLGAQPRLLICGAGHIAIPLARLTQGLGFEVTVLDDRPDFARPEHFPGATVRAEAFTPALAAMDLGPDPYVVIITRGHEYDAECLARVLDKPTRYVGMIGSKRRVRFVLEMLAREGCAAERLEQVFTPIGLPIGSETPEEIALSIAAELVCVRRKGPQHARKLREAVALAGEGAGMTDLEIFRRLQQYRDTGVGGCLATIVEAAGSTPRGAGAKMLVCADGSTYGSVGGGCSENQVRSSALRCLLGSGEPELLEVDLTDDLGTRGGDVCGGRLWILVEPF